MKRLILLFVISFGFNIYFAVNYFINKHLEKSLIDLFDVRQVAYIDGLLEFKDKLNEIAPKMYNSKKYFFVQTWDTITGASMSSRSYMETLDSMALRYKTSNIGFIFISEMKKNTIEEFNLKKGIVFKNFVFVYDASNFISSVFTRKNLKYKTHPIQFIIDKDGNFLYYKSKEFTNPMQDTILMNALNLVKL